MANLEMMMQQKAEEEAARVRLMNEMQQLEMEAEKAQPKYTSSATIPTGVRVANPEEIDLDEEEEEKEEEPQPGSYQDTMEVEAKAVPQSVIERNVGSAAAGAGQTAEDGAQAKPAMGALARLKRKGPE
jgi:hypothetical protein